MVLAPKETTVAYRCPECGALVMSMVGVFTLTADMMRLKCPCEGSALEIIYTKDKKVRLNVPCFACPSPHSFQISSQIFFEKELFALPCAYSGLDICFIGKADKVQQAAKEAEEELMELLGDTDFETYAAARGERGELTDPQVYDIVLYVIQELQDEGAVHCHCPEGEGEYVVDILADMIRVTCKNCAASVEIPTGSLTAARDFLETCDRLDLT
ncbi:MAG: hypothetical protein E7631_03295 [Ruminococcaceae bacterium]|nr:hypothetical protein [Oscillospiraceae bacterium]